MAKDGRLRLAVTYTGPTDTRGSRMVVRGGGRVRTYSYDYAARDAFLAAAEAFRDELAPGGALDRGPVSDVPERRVFMLAPACGCAFCRY